MEYNGWYILHGLFQADIKKNGSWKFYQLQILSFEPKTKKIILKDGDENLTIILDNKKMDPYFKNKEKEFEVFINKYIK
jgi:hypothetical protein